MTNAYVVTEGQSDADILKMILPPDIVKASTFVVGSGRYSAQSIAGSILATRRRPVALVIDADEGNDRAVQERQDFLKSLLGQAAADVAFEVFIFRPEIEIIFFHDPLALAKIVGSEVDEASLNNARYEPYAVLTRLLGQDTQYLMGRLDDDTIARLREHPVISDLTRFLTQMVAQPT